ncbi:Poly(A) RNA polymerase protein cid1 [Cytospora mali]|uniref:polynucleotide adenylyltransferase n=1 Tax=Cytospora mali TaxID=578113 RepID=A0A194VW09_CYTMA|nr:Poly(A) RNA polymerase protein cid1 [Valsa mali]
MATMQDINQQDGVPLEVRMRNLIIKNSDTAQAEGAAANVPRSTSSAFVHPTNTGEPNASATSQDDPNQHKSAQKAGRKRMNQAQRRQMSTQLSVAIDPRATESQPNQPFGNPSGNNYRHNQQNRNQRSQSTAWRPVHTNDGFARHNPSPSYPGISSTPSLFDWRQQGGIQNGFTVNQPGFSRPNHAARNSGNQAGPLYAPRPYHARTEDLGAQAALLEQLCAEIRANAEINYEQIKEKEDFRLLIEDACRVAITQYEANVNGRTDFPPFSVQLRCFGSLSSGFATKSSDMDLGLLSPLSHPRSDSQDSPIPRLIERTFLDMGLGARLLSKTRIPIIKICQKPPEKLYLDLLEERTKWEKGVDDDHELEEEDVKDGHHSNDRDLKNGKTNIDDDIHGVVEGHLDEKSGTVCSDEHGIHDYQATLNDLRQGAKTLPNYYASAKKVLRKLGGKDITNSTAASFTDDDFRILNDVCKTFVHGLADEYLRTRLEGYASLSFDENAPMPPNRSIFGVMTQVEGEKMVIAFENREINEKDDHFEQIARNRVAHWKELQNRLTCGLDPLSFNKELMSATELLKKTPSIGLLLLEQGQYESAASYHSRTIRLMIELGGHDLASSQSPVLPVVIRQYLHGIYDHEIRAQVSEFLGATQATTLRAIARRHKSLHLAREFERALEKGLYSIEYADDVRAYIDLLRGPMSINTSGNVHFDAMLPMTPEGWRLVAKMREIPDPSRMSPNQPRDPYKDKLEFPKSGVGVQCDINFSAQLALQNTHLLRCYSLTDDRVRPLVLFVKHWAKVRGINTPYRGTLSSYGYVLMVLHYLVNVARPFVCPNLQLMAPPVDPDLTPEQIANTVNCQGRDIRFWRDENQIASMAQQGMLNQNKDSIGYLLRGFFEYYAQSNMMSTGHGRGFDWGRDVISLRTHGGILSKQAKGWTGAKTVLEVQSSNKPPATEPEMPQANPNLAKEGQNNGNLTPASQAHPSPDATAVSKTPQDRGKPEVKEVRHRFLFAIEDPFELEHNVARTVTHNGIVSIRDEFRRAWRLIKNAGRSQSQEMLLQDISVDRNAENTSFQELLDEIHGHPPS